MKRIITPIIEHIKKLDFFIVFSALGMTILSILTLVGAKDAFGSRYPIIQAITTLVGFILMVIISAIDLEDLINRIWPIFIGISIVGLVIVLLFGTSPDGSQNNWIKIPGIPIEIQPSEFVKITFIFSFAKHISLVKDHINKFTTVLLLALHGFAIIGLLLLTGDLGSALIYIIIMGAMLFSAGLSTWYFLAALAIMAILFPYIWPHLAKYQQMRILCGFNPELDPEKYGYNALKSREAIANGGFFGQGMFGGTKYQSVPVVYADFLFAALVEKFGVFGSMLYMACISIMIIRLIWMANKSKNSLVSLVYIGICAILLAQTIENIGMCLGMLPVVGITLPFFSYGGSSLLSLFLCLGVIQSMKVHSDEHRISFRKNTYSL